MISLRWSLIITCKPILLTLSYLLGRSPWVFGNSWREHRSSTPYSPTRLSTRLWDQDGKAVNHDPDVLIQTQDLPPIYEENSCMYIFSKDVFLQKHNRLGFHPMMYEIDPSEAWDIDDEIDFLISDLLMTHQNNNQEVN